MRVSVGSFLFLAYLFANPQSSSDLRSRYGGPDMERFVVRSGIGLTVEYGSDGLACEMLIEPPLPIIHGDEQTLFMSAEGVTRVLDDVVPTGTRGLKIGNAVSQMGRNKQELIQYENLSISRSTDEGVPLRDEREIRAMVNFNRDVCRTQSKQIKPVP
jgi:hypothetical protein